jgi:methylase of polypeptide subunit release factors
MDIIASAPPVVPGLYFSSTGPANLRIYYQPGQDGGGTWFGQEYVDVIADRYRRRFGTCFEWCAGPGFIGYSVLDHGLCDRLVLADCYAPAVEAAQQTANDPQNRLEDRAEVHHSHTIRNLPAMLPFDLVVGNPPHFYHPPEHEIFDRLDCDPGWLTHQEFFHNIGQRLSDDGVILLQENWKGSQPDTFRAWIADAGLTITDWWPSQKWFHEGQDCQIYYIEIKKAK